MYRTLYCSLTDFNFVEDQSACEPTGHYAGAYLWFLKHEAARNISIPLGWDVSPSPGYPQHKGIVPGLDPRPLDPEASVLTMRPLRFHYRSITEY